VALQDPLIRDLRPLQVYQRSQLLQELLCFQVNPQFPGRPTFLATLFHQNCQLSPKFQALQHFQQHQPDQRSLMYQVFR